MTDTVRNSNMKDWFLQNFGDDYFQTPELRQEAAEFMGTVTIKSEGAYGTCSRCATDAPIHGYTWPSIEIDGAYFSDYIEEYLCEPCHSRMLVWQITNRGFWADRMSGTYYRISPTPIPGLVNPTESRDFCPACRTIMLKEHDYGYENNPIIIAILNDGETGQVHRRCSFVCDAGNHDTCGETFARGEYVRNSNARIITRRRSDRDHILCESCFDSYREALIFCESCNNYDWENNGVWSEYHQEMFCAICASDTYIQCDDCDSEYRIDREHRCHQSGVSGIYYYSYKPSPRFYGADKYHFGIELEMEAPERGDTELSEGVATLYNLLGERIYLKEDASISYGFEMVTHPHTLEEFQTQFNWNALKEMTSLGFRSWDTTTCGLHVHVSRSAFDSRHNKVNKHQLKFIKFVYDNQRPVQALAGRETSYAKFNDKGRLVQKLEHGIGDGHFSAVNTDPDDTLEIRVFKGSLNPVRVLSAIEFVHASIEHTRDMRVSPKDKPMAWTKFIAYVVQHEAKYPNLTTMLEKTLGVRNPNTKNEED